MILYLTVYDRSMGCVLGQQDVAGKKEQAIAHRLKQIVLYHTTWLITRLDPLKYIFEKPSLLERLAKWHVMLSKYDIVHASQKVIKRSVIAKFLVERATDYYELMKLDFLDKDLMTISREEKKEPIEKPWKMFFDGASNALRHEIRVILISLGGNYYPNTTRLDFNCTNNVVEYEACIMGLQMAIVRKIGVLEAYGDSTLVIYQLCGEWETRDYDTKSMK
ncbi:uncharacterized protein LOC111281569 [Durio zibethinus]|uniref:Uncharacterized protein LOC111281569 n=1 Tax=Durio zibethinus TaxID=66656 RepID=A0A6P5X9U4_DURZI|nr:uncharacterized protein LOC111281569 [Durio zibethinus]